MSIQPTRQTRRGRWLRRAALFLGILSVAGLALGAWGYSRGWDRYIHYRHLPDWNRSHEQALMATLTTTPPASAAATPVAGMADAAPPAATPPAGRIDMLALDNGNVRDESIDSPVLGKRFHFRIYLPPGYDDRRFAHTRYPVVYLLHGAPGGCNDWVDGAAANQTADALIRTSTIRPLIIVMPDGSLGDPHHDTQWGNSPVTGERVEDAIINDLIPAIDRQYRTLAKPEARAIGGLSSGGYGAVNIALHHPDDFGVVLSLSGYFTAENTYDKRDIWGSDAVRNANSPALNVHPLAEPLHIDIIEGLDEGQGVADTKAFDASLTAAGIDHQTQLAAGGHAWDFWKTHLFDALRYADQHFPTANNDAASRTRSPRDDGGGAT